MQIWLPMAALDQLNRATLEYIRQHFIETGPIFQLPEEYDGQMLLFGKQPGDGNNPNGYSVAIRRSVRKTRLKKES